MQLTVLSVTALADLIETTLIGTRALVYMVHFMTWVR
jgi:hypothetical protein